MAKQEVTVPDIGGAEGAEVIELLVSVGDEVSVEQGLIVLESDKASMEIPSSHAGKVLELLVSEGDELAEGSPIVLLETSGDEAASSGSGEEDADAEGAGSGDENGGAPQDEAGQDESQQEAGSEASGDDGQAKGGDSGAGSQSGSEEVVSVPDIGTDDAVDLIEISVKVGDSVAEGDSLVVLESDKASMEVPSPQAGEVLELLVEEGASVRQGDPLLKLRSSGGHSSAREREAEPEEQERASKADSEDKQPAAAPEQSPAGEERSASSEPERAESSARPPAASAERSEGLVYAGPAVRKLARELGVELKRVQPSGPRERVLKEDVQEFVKSALTGGGPGVVGAGIPAVPEVDFAAFGETTSESRSKLEKLTAANMQRSWLNVPHVTQFDDADITELEEFRRSLKPEAEQRGTRMTPMPFLLKACAIALRDHPRFRASLSPDGESLIYKQYVHIGMAVDTPAGLLVPVIRDVDQKSLWELAEEVVDLAGRARERKLKPAEMQGGCFTVSSLGGIGGRGFTPIVNTPEVGILGVSRAEQRPVWNGTEFVPRQLLPLSLSYDHRVINGGDAGRFCTALVELLGDIRRLLL